MKRTLLFALCMILLASLCFGAANIAAADDGGVVYISDDGADSNEGTLAKPVKTLRTAYKRINGNGTVVVCGPLSVNSAENYLPSSQGKVYITSKYDGRTHYSGVLRVGGKLYLGGDTEFSEIDIEAAPATMFFCCGNNVRFGEGISVSLSGSGSYPYVFGGTWGGRSGATSDNNSFFGYTVQVDSGTWTCVRGGNYRTDSNQPMGFVGDVSVIINGGLLTGTGSGTDLAVLSATSFCGLEGDARLEINGATVQCAVYGIGRPGSCSSALRPAMRGNVSIKINSKNAILSGIGALQQPEAGMLDGDMLIKVEKGSVSRSIDGTGVKGVCRVLTHSESLQKKAVACARTVYISDNGSDANSGLSADKPIKTYMKLVELAKGERGVTVVVCGDFTLDYPVLADDSAPFGDNLPSNAIRPDGGVYLTSTNGAKLKILRYPTFNCDLYMDEMTLCAVGDSAIISARNITVGSNVSTEGSINLLGLRGDEPMKIEVHSGDFQTVGGGYNAHSSVVMYGGSVKYLVGTGNMISSDGASVIMYGGKAEQIIGAQYGCHGNVGIAVYGGEVGSIIPCQTGTVDGDLGLISEGASVSISDIDKVKGKKYFSSSRYSVPDGFEDVGAVVYVTDGGTGDGASALAPAPSIYQAVKGALDKGERDISVVILGTYKQEGNEKLDAVAGKLTIGGNVCCVDFHCATNSTLRLGGTFDIMSDAVIDGLDIISVSDKAYIAANGNSLVIDKVNCDRFFDKGVKNYPSIVGGSLSTCSKAAHVTVNSGTWQYVYGGNLRSGVGTAPKTVGDIKVVINGGEYRGGVFANGMNSLDGSASLEINGGVLSCGVFATAQSSSTVGGISNITGELRVKITGGELRGDILAAHTVADIRLNGKYVLDLLGGNFTRVNRIEGTEKLANGSVAESVLNIHEDVNVSGKLEGSITVQNPIAGFADPSVYFYDGWYYYTYSSTYKGKPALWVTRAANIADIGASTPIMIWSAAVSGTGAEIYSLWAPQIYFLDGKWYVYATCSVEVGNNDNRKPYVWVGKGDSPYDGFDMHGKMDNCDDQVYMYLSPRVFEYQGRRFLICGGFYRREDRVVGQLHLQKMIIGELASPTSFKTKMTVISEPTKAWESEGKVHIQEGPYPIIAPDGTLYIAYSANATSGENYCTGLLRFAGSKADHITKASYWHKLNEPMHKMDPATGIYSPGAMVFVPEPDGTGLWGIYHIKQFYGAVYNHRVLFAQQLQFVNNVPTMPSPQPTSVTYEMKLNGMPIEKRISGFDTISTVGDAPTPPVTEPPVTEPPATEPPATEPPVTEPPVTEPPVTEPPVTEPPVTEPPATEPPATEPPATEPPATEPPVTEPVTEIVTTDAPITTASPATTTAPVADDGGEGGHIITAVIVGAVAAIIVVILIKKGKDKRK